MPPKFKTKLPAARIKRIMRTDEEVGKVAQSTPVLIAKAVESFLSALVQASLVETKARDAKKITAAHVKKAVEKEPKFDFLIDKVADLPDPQQELPSTEKGKKSRKKKDAMEDFIVDD